MPGGLVNVIVRLYPHLVRYSAEALEAPGEEEQAGKQGEKQEGGEKKVARIRGGSLRNSTLF